MIDADLYIDEEYFNSCIDWLDGEFESLTDNVITLSPSEWAETRRYLPPSVTPLPGYYSWDISPPLREILDCMDPRSPIKEASLQKGAQIGATVGLIENYIGYSMDQVKSAPTMMLTADAELAAIRLQQYIIPMIQQSELDHLIRSSDEGNNRKTGKTDSKIEWEGGGFLVPFGAINAAKLRSISIQFLLEDECDGYPGTVGKDGDPAKLAEARTKAYYELRKILRLSTPLIAGQSRINRAFKDGDQRYYNVPCKSCGKLQVLRFNGVNKETGELWGLIWEMEEGRLKPGSVRYLCKFCGHPHVNSDKVKMLKNGKWIPTAKPKSPDVRSYHLSALYAPAEMYPWDAITLSYLDAFDVENNRVKDMGLFQEFYNNDLGEPFEIRGDRIKRSTVSKHRRSEYRFGEIPNEYALQYAGSSILMLVCSVDVHKHNLAVAVFGWTKWGRVFVLDYWRYEGECEQINDKDTWERLRNLIECKEYVADDGRRYKIQLTLIDSSYSNELVCTFCAEFESNVVPVIGRDAPSKNQTIKEFAPFTTQVGTAGFRITVNMYKDRWSAALKRGWDGLLEQPKSHFNLPVDVTDKQLKELTAERRVEKKEKSTGRVIGYEWLRPSGVDNELWDLLIYASAGLDIMAWEVCRNHFEMEQVNWAGFWDLLEQEELYIEKK